MADQLSTDSPDAVLFGEKELAIERDPIHHDF
jgi:hypothetical protein